MKARRAMQKRDRKRGKRTCHVQSARVSSVAMPSRELECPARARQAWQDRLSRRGAPSSRHCLLCARVYCATARSMMQYNGSINRALGEAINRFSTHSRWVSGAGLMFINLMFAAPQPRTGHNTSMTSLSFFEVQHLSLHLNVQSRPCLAPTIAVHIQRRPGRSIQCVAPVRTAGRQAGSRARGRSAPRAPNASSRAHGAPPRAASQTPRRALRPQGAPVPKGATRVVSFV